MSADDVFEKAVNWWKNKRPLSWSEEFHLENPDINCSTGTEKSLALAIAKALKERK